MGIGASKIEKYKLRVADVNSNSSSSGISVSPLKQLKSAKISTLEHTSSSRSLGGIVSRQNSTVLVHSDTLPWIIKHGNLSINNIEELEIGRVIGLLFIFNNFCCIYNILGVYGRDRINGNCEDSETKE